MYLHQWYQCVGKHQRTCGIISLCVLTSILIGLACSHRAASADYSLPINGCYASDPYDCIIHYDVLVYVDSGHQFYGTLVQVTPETLVLTQEGESGGTYLINREKVTVVETINPPFIDPNESSES